MALTLTITDLVNGTGATATVAGSNASSTNTLYYAAWTGTMGQVSWTTGSNRTGDGNISAAIATGYYLWKLESVLAGATTTAFAFQNVSDVSMVAVYYRIMLGVQTVIRSLNLTGLVSASVNVKKFPRKVDQVDTTPLIDICPFNAVDYPGVLNQRDDLGYPVLVTMIDKANQDFTANLARISWWSEKISRSFRQQRVPGVPETFRARPQKMPLLDETAFHQANLDISYQFFRFDAREVRGIGA